MALNRSMRQGVAGLLAVLSMGTLAACAGDDDADAEPADSSPLEPAAGDGDGDGDVDADAGGGASDGEPDAADDSGGGDSAGGDDVDFSIPAPDGLVLDVLADAGLDMAASGQRQLYYENDDFDRVVAFYDDWTSQNGEWFKGEAEGTVVFQDIGSDFVRQVTITPEHDPGAQADGPVTFVLLVTNE